MPNLSKYKITLCTRVDQYPSDPLRTRVALVKTEIEKFHSEFWTNQPNGVLAIGVWYAQAGSQRS